MEISSIDFVENEIYEFDITRLYSPAEQRSVQAHNRAVYEARRLAEQAIQKAAERDRNHANRILTDEEYYAMKKKENEERQFKQKMHELEIAAKRQAQIDYMNSSPDEVKINANNPFELTQQINHWVGKRGYVIQTENIFYFISGCYALTLSAPPAKRKSVQ